MRKVPQRALRVKLHKRAVLRVYKNVFAGNSTPTSKRECPTRKFRLIAERFHHVVNLRHGFLFRHKIQIVKLTQRWTAISRLRQRRAFPRRERNAAPSKRIADAEQLRRKRKRAHRMLPILFTQAIRNFRRNRDRRKVRQMLAKKRQNAVVVGELNKEIPVEAREQQPGQPLPPNHIHIRRIVRAVKQKFDFRLDRAEWLRHANALLANSWGYAILL